MDEGTRIALEDEFLAATFGSELEGRSFAECLRARLAQGAEAYGDASFSRPLSELLGEIEQEQLDTVGWCWVIWTALRRAGWPDPDLLHQVYAIARRARLECEALAALRVGVTRDEFAREVLSQLTQGMRVASAEERLAAIVAAAERLGYQLDAEEVLA